MSRPTIADRIARFSPCGEAAIWAAEYTSPEKAWAECHRGDWMLWLLGQLIYPPRSADRKRLVLCACECARLSLPIFENRYPKDRRVRKCIETTERWANGEATIEELCEARSAAYAAATYGNASNAAYAATSASNSANAAATYAAAAAADAADATYAAARARTLKRCAQIVRNHYPKPPRLAKREVSA